MADDARPLFDQLIQGKSLPHPTSRNFDEATWESAWNKLTNRSDRDERLLVAAIVYGRQLKSLRQTYEHKLFAGMSKRAAFILSAAMANYNFIALQKKARSSAQGQTKKGEVVHLNWAANQPIELGSPQNIGSSDAATAAIVDTIPHCIERANHLPETSVAVCFLGEGAKKELAALSAQLPEL